MITRKTWVLLVLAGLLLALNVLDRGPPSDIAVLPVVPAVAREAVTRIELSGAEDKVVLKPEGERWRVVAPYQADADQQAVRALLSSFRKEIQADVQIDTGNIDKYGLEPGKGHVVEVWTSGEEPVLSLTVGDDTAGGTNFVRFSGSDAVYRARLGGRARFAKSPSEWRSRYVLDLAPERVVGLVLRRDGAELTLSRPAAEGEGGKPGPWTLDPAPPWAIDQALADGLAARIAQLRAGAFLPADTDPGPIAAEVELLLDDGGGHTLRLHPRSDGALLATVAERDERYRVSESLLDVLPRELADLRDHTVLRLPAEDLDTLLLEDERGTVLLRQDAASRLWQLLQPAGLELDVRQVLAAASTLAALRAEALVASPGPFGKPSTRVTITLVDGTALSLEIGQSTTDPAGRVAWTARRAGLEQVFLLSDETVKRIRAGFGRS